MSDKTTINGKKFNSLKQGCLSLGIDLDRAKYLKRTRGNKFIIKVIREYKVEIGVCNDEM